MARSLSLDIGVVRNFGRLDIGVRGLKRGWAVPEDAHNWNDGPETVLLLSAVRPDFRCILVIEGVPLINAGIARQDVTTYGNGLRLGFWRLTSPHLAQLEVMLEPTDWRPHDEAASLELAVHLPDSVRPSSVGREDDDRELGFCFRTLALFPAPHGR